VWLPFFAIRRCDFGSTQASKAMHPIDGVQWSNRGRNFHHFPLLGERVHKYLCEEWWVHVVEPGASPEDARSRWDEHGMMNWVNWLHIEHCSAPSWRPGFFESLLLFHDRRSRRSKSILGTKSRMFCTMSFFGVYPHSAFSSLFLFAPVVL